MLHTCRSTTKRQIRVSAWMLLLFFAPLALLPCLPGEAQARARKAARPAPAAEAPVDAVVRRFQVFLARKNASLADLRKLEAQLDQALGARPDGPDGAKAAFFLARVQEEAARKTSLKADWFKSAQGFGDYLERFPKHLLAPDAHLRRGVIRLKYLANAEGAQADFQAVLRNYPRSRLVAQARSLSRQAARAARSGKPAAAEPEAARASGPAGKAQLMEVRPQNHGRTARVVLDLDEPVRFKYQLLEPAGGKDAPDRVYVDLLGTRLGAAVQEDMSVPGGILKSIRAGQRDADTVRVVFNFSDLKDYKIQTLENPFRLVIDATAGTALKEQPKHEPREAAAEPESSGIATPTGSRQRLAANLVEQLGLSVRTIMVDAGHGGKDPGAQGYGLTEKDVNLRMALILGKVLKDRKFNVIYTRTTDVFLALEERTTLANAKKADLFLSVHCNAHTDPGMSGLETYSLNLARTPDAVRVAARENSVSDKNISDLQMILTDLMLTSKIKESVDLARGVHSRGLANIRRTWTVADHGNREAPFYVLMGAKMPSALLEIGYITNKTEAARLNNDYYLRTLAKGIADGVQAYKNQIERFAEKKKRRK
ncbi:MAG: N-acetylmuramoyl-L-alanine amidase [Proteobacteria bacterium]|nr:N-acetylmuramoyl-L-alanine amidase [Pseudomonadota bacterium]MBU1595796.1 N-acetylmuramoyl-L-alanine amidase [Pseudomonadota bacterium]